MLGNRALLQEATNKHRSACHHVNPVKSFGDGFPSIVQGNIVGGIHKLDEGDLQGNQFLGSGKEIGDEDVVVKVLRQVITEFRDGLHPAWSAEVEAEDVDLLEHSRADLAGKEVVFSTSYAKTFTRVSYNVYARFEEPVRGEAVMKEYVCTLQRFVKATLIKHRCPPIRIAIADL